MKNKLKKRLICHRLITALALLFAPAEALQGHNKTVRGSRKHNSTIFIFYFLDDNDSSPTTIDGFISNVVAHSL